MKTNSKKKSKKSKNLGDAEPDLFGCAGMTNAERRKSYHLKKRAELEAAGKTKAAEIDRNVLKVKELRESGMKWKDVAAT